MKNAILQTKLTQLQHNSVLTELRSQLAAKDAELKDLRKENQALLRQGTSTSQGSTAQTVTAKKVSKKGNLGPLPSQSDNSDPSSCKENALHHVPRQEPKTTSRLTSATTYRTKIIGEQDHIPIAKKRKNEIVVESTEGDVVCGETKGKNSLKRITPKENMRKRCSEQKITTKLKPVRIESSSSLLESNPA